MLKIAVSPTGEIKQGVGCHASLIGPGTNFDKWVRAIYWADKNVIYFRLWAPDGLYNYPDEDQKVRSIDKCLDTLESLIKRGIVPKKVKPVLWDDRQKLLDAGIKSWEIG